MSSLGVVEALDVLEQGESGVGPGGKARYVIGLLQGIRIRSDVTPFSWTVYGLRFRQFSRLNLLSKFMGERYPREECLLWVL